MKRSISILCILLSLLALPLNVHAAQLLPGGQLIGLELDDQTLTVAAFDPRQSAAQAAGLQVGDRITKIDNTQIRSTQDIHRALSCSKGSVRVHYSRKGKAHTLQIEPTITPDGPRLGIYLKQGINGVGTITYYDPETGDFGALGHGVNDPDGTVLKMAAGNAYAARIVDIKKGKTGAPGQLMGSMHTDQLLGSLSKNTNQGVFGKMQTIPEGTPIQSASSDQVRTGDAVIRSTVCDGITQEYSVKILKIYPNSRSGNRNMLIKVTDENLLQTTGGIIQGMSGSPIIQNGKLVGAVTHVLVNDPTTGYGIFIENMLNAAA